MTQEWINSNFPKDGDDVIIRVFNDGFFQTTSQDFLINQFGNLSSPPTYEELSSTQLALNGGWQPIFDEWHSKGII